MPPLPRPTDPGEENAMSVLLVGLLLFFGVHSISIVVPGTTRSP
jgi:hypothetical protein